MAVASNEKIGTSPYLLASKQTPMGLFTSKSLIPFSHKAAPNEGGGTYAPPPSFGAAS